LGPFNSLTKPTECSEKSPKIFAISRPGRRLLALWAGGCGLRERKGIYVSLSEILPDISAAAGWLNLNPGVVF